MVRAPKPDKISIHGGARRCTAAAFYFAKTVVLPVLPPMAPLNSKTRILTEIFGFQVCNCSGKVISSWKNNLLAQIWLYLTPLHWSVGRAHKIVYLKKSPVLEIKRAKNGHPLPFLLRITKTAKNFPIHSNRKKYLSNLHLTLSHRLNSYPYIRKVLWFSHPYLHISQTIGSWQACWSQGGHVT